MWDADHHILRGTDVFQVWVESGINDLLDIAQPVKLRREKTNETYGQAASKRKRHSDSRLSRIHSIQIIKDKTAQHLLIQKPKSDHCHSDLWLSSQMGPVFCSTDCWNSRHSRALIYDALPQLLQPSSSSFFSLSDSLCPTSLQALLFCWLRALLYFSALPPSGFSPYLSPSPVLPLNTDTDALAHYWSSSLCNLPDSRRRETQQHSSPPFYSASLRVSKTSTALCIVSLRAIC